MMRRALIVLCVSLLTTALGGGMALSGDTTPSGSGEEPGTELGLSETLDSTRKGARLTLAYDDRVKAFVGAVQNTTDETLLGVRVEVHLSNGKELGPTPARDLKPGARMPVQLSVKTKDFDRWSAHTEVGTEEHGHDHGEGHEHDHDHG
ncbi:MAG: hypothetical protein GY716_25345 [bacterium]|nr:hypothetical protein [bacterium]